MYVGPGKETEIKIESSQVDEALFQFPNLELALCMDSDKKLGKCKAANLKVPEPSSLQNAVYYILSKNWCSYDGSQMSMSYGFPAFNMQKEVIGFYREAVYEKEGLSSGLTGVDGNKLSMSTIKGCNLDDDEEEEEDSQDGLGLFIPISDVPEIISRTEIVKCLEAEIRKNSKSVYDFHTYSKPPHSTAADSRQTVIMRIIKEGVARFWFKKILSSTADTALARGLTIGEATAVSVATSNVNQD